MTKQPEPISMMGKRKTQSFRIDENLINLVSLIQTRINEKRTAAQGSITKDQLANDAFKLLVTHYKNNGLI
jgi:hypothetical protein